MLEMMNGWTQDDLVGRSKHLYEMGNTVRDHI